MTPLKADEPVQSEYRDSEWYTVARLEKALKRSKENPIYFSIGGHFEFARVFYCSRFPFVEIYRNVFSQLQSAMHRHLITPKRFRGEREASVVWILETIEHIATRRELPELDQFIKSSAQKLEQAGRPLGALFIRQEWSKTRPSIVRRFGKLGSIQEAIERVKVGKPLDAFPKSDLRKPGQRREDFEPLIDDDHLAHPIQLPVTGSEDMKRVREYLLQHTTEQNEIVESVVSTLGKLGYFQRLELPSTSDDENIDLIERDRKEVAAQRSVEMIRRKFNPLISLNGLANNGQSNFAQNLTDALYGYEGAWIDHLVELPVISSHSKIHEIPGSPPSYIGSQELSPSVKALIAHCGGRYRIETRTDGRSAVEYVVENEEWLRERRDLDGHWNLAIVSVNDWQDWTRAATDEILKPWIETGYFKIGSPNGGLDRIFIRPIFVLNSTYGMRLLSPREKNGERFGPAPTESQIQESWRLNKDHPEKITSEMLAGNSGVNSPDRSQDAKGVSPAFVNLLPNSSVFLMRPLTREGVKREVVRKLEDLKLLFSLNQKYHLDLKFTPQAIDFVTDYRWVPDENARQSVGNVEALIENTIFQTLDSGNIKPCGTKQTWKIDIAANADGTSNLIFTKSESSENFSVLIEATKSEKTPEPLSPTEIDKILALPERISERVVLDRDILERQADVALHSANLARMKDDPTNPQKKADIQAYFGLTSTGKTLLAKMAVEAEGGRPEDLLEIDLSHIAHREQLSALLMGTYNSLGEGQPSKVTKHWDARHGRNVRILLDELSNASRDTWLAAFELLREPTVKNFADGHPRYMGDTSIKITSNIGQDWFQDIPKEAPMMQRLFAAERIYDEATSNPDYIEAYLLSKIPQPMVARIDPRNIFFMRPLNFEKIRKIAQMKVLKSIQKLSSRPGKHGWNIGFRDSHGYKQFLEDIETHGFKFASQGQSIETFVTEEFEARLDTFLMRNRVPIGARVTVVPTGLVPASNQPKERKQLLTYDLFIEEQSAPLKFSMKGRNREIQPTQRPDDQILVAAHEAWGHELVRKVLLKDKYDSFHLSIVPGVGNIAGRWLMYLGIAEFEKKVEVSHTWDGIINEMAVLHAGYIAESLMSRGGVHSAGKTADMEMATRLAKIAIVKGGLSSDWGVDSVPPEKSIDDYIATLSEARKVKLDELVKKMMGEAALRAKAVMLKNRDNIGVPLTIELATVGDMGPAEIAAFYEKHEPIYEIGPADLEAARQYVPESERPNLSLHERTDPELATWFPRERITKLADIGAFIERARKAQIDTVPLSPSVRYFPASSCLDAARQIAEKN